MKTGILTAAVSCALLTLSQSGAAQTATPSPALGVATPPASAAVSPMVNPGADPTGTEASGIPADGLYRPTAYRLGQSGVFVTPTLGVTIGYNDNLRITSTNRISSNFLVLSPRLLAEAAYRADRYTLGYQADVIRYGSSSRDDIENQELAATGQNVFGTRTGVNWRASLSDRFDPIGSTQRSSGGAVTTPDHWQGALLSGTGRYGAPGARGRVEVDLGYFKKEYQNNRATTAGADFDSLTFATRLYTRVAPNTELLTEYRATQFDYRLDSNNLDNTEQRLLVGAQWRATAKTSGIFKVGYLNKHFDRVRPSYSGGTWEGGVRWEPRTYSFVEVSTGRTASDPSGTGTNFILSSFVSGAWTHRWRSFFSTRVNFLHIEDDYNGASRRDRTNTLGISAAYDVRRNVRASLALEHTKRDSSISVFDYTRNLATARVELAF